MKRDKNGNHTLDGEESLDSPVKMNVKYEKEVRFALGKALVQMENGDIIGKRVKEFKYTKEIIASEKDW